MKYSLNVITLFSIFLINAKVNAQSDFQGSATYISKTSVDIDKWGGNKMSPERKKMMMERMKSFLEKTFILTFNKTESIYKEEEQLGAPGGKGGFGAMMGSFTGGAQYKNVKESVMLQEQEFFGKQFLINDSIPDLDWEMTGETKQIGKYMCFKATAVKPVDEFDWTNMRRKGKGAKKKEEVNADQAKKEISKVETDSSKSATKSFMDDIEMPKEVEVVAWYTMQVPISNGPGEFSGLPGLILELNTGRTTILCASITLNPEEKKQIKRPTKGKIVTKKEYNDIVNKKMTEMKEMYGGRRGKGRRK
jgi:GLPGLI family protein